jgi:hypothetical protein
MPRNRHRERKTDPINTQEPTMAKYYIQSGTLRTVVQAQSRRKAAIWAIHQAMQQVLPIDQAAGETPESKGESAGAAELAVLDAHVRISERGFDRDDASVLETIDALGEWTQLVTTLDRLERMLHRGA